MENIPSQVLDVFEWYKKFSEGREDVQDDKCHSHLIIMKTEENVERVRTVVKTDCQDIRVKVLTKLQDRGKKKKRPEVWSCS
jgi:hypothetical protein